MNKIYSFLVLLLGGMLLTACDPKLDYDNMDPSVKVEMALTLPVGEVSVKVGDFLTDTTFDGLVINEDGVYQYQKTVNMPREFHAIVLGDYLSETDQEFVILNNMGLPEGVNGTLQAGIRKTLTFPLGLKLSNINDMLSDERIDSMQIDSARFTSRINLSGIDLQMTDIEHVYLDLPAGNFRRAAGNRVEIPMAGFDQDIPIKIDNFTLNLLKDNNLAASNENVVDSVTFNIVFEIKTNHDVAVTSDAKINYHFQVDLLDYSAVYGYFQEGNKVHEEDYLRIVTVFPEWANFKKFLLPFSDPVIRLDLHTTVGAPVLARIDKFIAYPDPEYGGEPKEVTFMNESGQRVNYFEQHLPDYVKYDDPLEQVAHNTMVFDKNNGELDKIFETRPDSIFYKFSLTTDQSRPCEHRLVRNTKIDVDVTFTIPFAINDGMSLAYKDTFEVSLDQYSIDSLIAEVEQIDSIQVNDLAVVLTAKSTLPFDVQGDFYFLDENGNDLGIKLDNETTGIHLTGLKKYDKAHGIVEAGETMIAVRVNQEKLDKLAKVKSISLYAEAKDFEKKADIVYPVALTPETALSIKLGLTADVAAYAKLAFGNNK